MVEVVLFNVEKKGVNKTLLSINIKEFPLTTSTLFLFQEQPG
jgi:hypothetical protein